MRRMFRAGTLSAVLALGLAAAGCAAAESATAASQAPCEVIVPTPAGPMTAVGSGTFNVNPAGNTTFTCHASLPVGTGIDKTMVLDLEPCHIVVNASGRVNAICH